MARVYLNDIDLDVLTQYINMENYDSVRNKPYMVPAKKSGARQSEAIHVLSDIGMIGDEQYTLYTVEGSGNIMDKNNDNVFYASLIDVPEQNILDVSDIKKSNIEPENILSSEIFGSSSPFSVSNKFISLPGVTEFPNFLCYTINYDSENLTISNVSIVNLDNITDSNYTGYLKYLPEHIRYQILNGDSINYTNYNGSYIKSVNHGYRNPMYILRYSVSTINSNNLLSSPGETYILVKPVLFEIQSTVLTNDGYKPLFIDSNGNTTVYERYDNNFYKHQNALRKAFFNICKESSWHNSFGPGELVLVEKKTGGTAKYQMQYYYNVFKRSYYTYTATTPTDAQIIYNSDIPMDIITDLEDPDKPETVYTDGVTHKETVLCGYIDDIPEFKAYIGSDETYINSGDMRFTNIVGIDADNIRSHANKPIILNCYKRHVNIGGKGYELSRLGTIKIDVRLTCGGETVGGETEFEVKSPELNPYIVVPILVTKDISSENSAIYKLLNAKLKIGSSEGVIKSHKGNNVNDLIATPRNLLGLYFSYNNNEIELYDNVEGLASDDIIAALGGIIGENDVWFAKVPVGDIVEKHIESIICELDEEYERISIEGSIDDISICVNTQTDLGASKPVKSDLPDITVVKNTKPVDTMTSKPGTTSSGGTMIGEGILMNRDRNKLKAVSMLYNMRNTAGVESNSTWDLIAFKPKHENGVTTNFNFSTEFKPSIVERIVYHENRFSIDTKKRYIEERVVTASLIDEHYREDLESVLPDTILTPETGKFSYLPSDGSYSSSEFISSTGRYILRKNANAEDWAAPYIKVVNYSSQFDKVLIDITSEDVENIVIEFIINETVNPSGNPIRQNVPIYKTISTGGKDLSLKKGNQVLEIDFSKIHAKLDNHKDDPSSFIKDYTIISITFCLEPNDKESRTLTINDIIFVKPKSSVSPVYPDPVTITTDDYNYPFVEIDSSSINSLGESPLAKTLFKDKFVVDNEVLKRGDSIQDDVILTRRTNAMSAALLNILNSPNNGDPLDLEAVMTRSDGREQIYNYSKAFISLLRHDYNKMTPEYIDIKDVENMHSDVDDIDKTILMEKVLYIEPDTPESYDGIIGISSAPRPLLRRLIEKDKFATEYEYSEYVRKNQGINNTLSGETVSDRNINLKYYNTQFAQEVSGIRTNNSTREMVAGGFTKFLMNPSETFLNFKISEKCIGNSSFDTEYYSESDNIIPNKKLYNIKYMNEDMLNDFISSLISITNESDNKFCMEVPDER